MIKKVNDGAKQIASKISNSYVNNFLFLFTI